MSRTPTAVDRIADDFLARYVVLDPIAATEIGLKGHDHEMTDLSPAGHAARTELAREALHTLEAATPADDTDRVTIEAMAFTLGTQLALDDAGGADLARTLQEAGFDVIEWGAARSAPVHFGEDEVDEDDEE